METKTENIFFERISVFGNESFFSEYATGFRFGFNGKEKTDELYGTGNAYDYGMRMYDARLGRFMSTDPLFKKYPELSTYQFASNRPIEAIDLDGKEALDARGRIYEIDGGSDIGTADRLIVHGEMVEMSGYGMMVTGAAMTFFSEGTMANYGFQLFEGGAHTVEVGGGMKATGEMMNGDVYAAATDAVFTFVGIQSGKAIKGALAKYAETLTPSTLKILPKIEVMVSAPVSGTFEAFQKAIEDKQAQSGASTTNQAPVDNPSSTVIPVVKNTNLKGSGTPTEQSSSFIPVIGGEDFSGTTTGSFGAASTASQTGGSKTPGFMNGIQGAPDRNNHSANNQSTP